MVEAKPLIGQNKKPALRFRKALIISYL
jgi:hypothetical protein